MGLLFKDYLWLIIQISHFSVNLWEHYTFDAIGQVRRGARVANEEILGFAKLFNDELTLDNISRLSLLLTSALIV